MAASTSDLFEEKLDGLKIRSVDEYDDVKPGEKRWSFQEEIRNLFAASLESSFPEIEQKPVIYASQERQDGDYNCQNVLSIWPKLRKSPKLQQKYSNIKVPEDVGKAIKNKLISTMIDGEASIQDVGFVAISLSQEWLSESIRKMLEDGIKTWAPELPPKSALVVDYLPMLKDIGWFQQRAITQTLVLMLEYCGVGVASTFNPETDHKFFREPVISMTWAEGVLMKSFRIEEREEVVVIDGKGKPPFSLAKIDFDNSYKHLRTLRYGFEEKKADWIIYVTPARHREYIQMCFTAAKLEEWYPSGRNEYPKTSYVGCQTFREPKEVLLFEELKSRCGVVAKGENAKSLGYSAEAILDCVLRYTFLKNHRLAGCTFDTSEMLNEKENTFVYLLNSLAQVRRITAKVKKDLEFILESSKGRNERALEFQRALEFHLLEFTEVLKDSCLFVLPHILCEYLYNLYEKFTLYYSLFESGSVVEMCTLLLCEATSVVMEKCFDLLGITREFSNTDVALQEIERNQEGLFVTPPSVSRDPTKNSRFELFSIRSTVTTDSQFNRSKLFGLISVSDKEGLLLDAGSHISEPDFAYVPVFNVDWSDPINTRNGGVVYLGDPSFRRLVPFSSSIEIRMELNVISENKDACFPLCNTKFEIDLSEFWATKLDSDCTELDSNCTELDSKCGRLGRLSVYGENAITEMYYILFRDAIDAVVEVRFKMKKDRKVCGYILAYCDDHDFPFDTYRLMGDCYWSLLVKSNCPFDLVGDKIALKKSILAVPVEGSLVIEANLEDYESGEVILKGAHTFKSQREHSSNYIFNGRQGTEFDLDVKVNWDYKV